MARNRNESMQESILSKSVHLAYGPLSKDRTEIRILTLFPGTWSDEIQCELTTESLDDPELIYHAVSYAWGHHSDLSSILVNDRIVPITPSLEAALREVRQKDRSLALWIDKLCINQDDEAEKAQQVGLMHRIFQRCSNVLIWLGPAEPPVEAAEKHELLRRWSMRSTTAAEGLFNAVFGCCGGTRKRKRSYDKLPQHDADSENDNPFAIIMHFAQDNHISDLPCFFRNTFNQLYFKETPAFHRMWLLFRHLLSRSWHQRLWTVQEALLATNAWVLYGSHRIPFSTIRKSIQNQRRHLYTCCSKVEKLFPSTYAFVPDAVYTSPALTGDLDRLLRMYRYKDCRNARDKIYGIAALFGDGLSIEVDYGRSVREIYTEAMGLIIEQCNGELRCLTGQGFSSTAHDLPTWVRDLGLRPSIESVHAEMRRLDAYHLYNACKGLSGPPRSLHTKDRLQVPGIHITTITTLTAPLDLPIEQCDAPYILRILLSWRRAAQTAGHSIPLLFPNVHKQAQTPFWRTITSSLIWQPSSMTFRRSTSSDADAYSTWLRKVLLQTALGMRPTLEDAFVQAMLCACFGRAMIVTREGGLGLCYANARVGDEVWVLRGGRVPVVLRRQGVDGEFGLVGDCYLDGYMDGKAVEEGMGVVEVVVVC